MKYAIRRKGERRRKNKETGEKKTKKQGIKSKQREREWQKRNRRRGTREANNTQLRRSRRNRRSKKRKKSKRKEKELFSNCGCQWFVNGWWKAGIAWWDDVTRHTDVQGNLKRESMCNTDWVNRL